MHSNATPHPMISEKIQELKGKLTVPGDKSISHRSLILGSQFLGTVEISNLLLGEDVLNTADALRKLGITIETHTNGHWLVHGKGIGGLNESADVLEMGNSGTSTRLLMGLVTPYPFTSFFRGDASLHSRPMQRVIQPLEQMGASIVSRSKGRLPLALIGTSSPMPISYRLPVASAQVKSAILLAGLNTAGTTTVIEPEATRDHTERMLTHMGFRVDVHQENGDTVISLPGQQSQARNNIAINVPGDPSSAAFIMVMALIAPKAEILIENVCINPLRIGLINVLKEMGAHIHFQNIRTVAGEAVADIEVKSSKLKAVTVPAEVAPSMIDEYPILSVAAAFAEGTTVMHGLKELRVKESDRLSGVANGLAACGVTVEVTPDNTLKVTGGNGRVKGGATITTRLDHRIAMSFLVMGTATETPVQVDDTNPINTSFPGFVSLCNRLGARMGMVRHEHTDSRLQIHRSFAPLVVAIDGPAASGKGTLARRLAEYFGYAYLDTGSLYRAVGMKIVYGNKDPHDVEDAIEAARSISLQDLANPRLRQERVGVAASIVSAIPEVREILLQYQRDFAQCPQGAILDGRDIGTVVCPDADIKIFMTADLEARARRRHRELQGQGVEVIFQSVLEDLRERDQRDEERHTAPLRAAEDAIHIDSSHMDANTVFEHALEILLPLAEEKNEQPPLTDNVKKYSRNG